MNILILFWMCFQLLQAVPTRKYEGDIVLRLSLQEQEHLELLKGLMSNNKYDFWREPVAVELPVDVQVAESDQEELFTLLTEHAIEYNVMIDDVQSLIDEQFSAPSKPSTRELDWDKYYTLEEINDWMEDVAERCGEDCEIFLVGTSYEGREIKGIKITRPGNNCAVYINGGIHAREWITPALATYIISRTIFDYGSDETTTTLRDHFDFYVEPVVNPDGYEYSWTTDRMWRKTRSPNNGTECMGTDGNRNFNYYWDAGVGQSTDPCDQTYRGSGPLSEPETSAMNDFLMPIRDPFISYLDMHSYSELVIPPWGYTDEPPADLDDIVEVLEEFTAAANEVHGKEYYVLDSVAAAGCTFDWAKGEALIKYSVALESRDNGTYGFLLPTEQILPSCEETWAGLQAMYVRIMEKEGQECTPLFR